MPEDGNYNIEIHSLGEPDVSVSIHVKGKSMEVIIKNLLEVAVGLAELHEVDVNISEAFKRAAG